MPMQDGYSQAMTREHMVYTDQHGREWEAWGDIKAKLHPTSPLCPATAPDTRQKKWSAPWYPDQHYMRFSVRKPGDFTIDYDAMIAEGVRAKEARKQHTFAVADHFNVKDFDPDTQEPTAQMRRELGGAPLPLEPILAAKAGNGFILGTRAFDANRPADVKLAAFLELYRVNPKAVSDGAEFADTEYADTPPSGEMTWPKFLAEQSALGKSRAEISGLWSEYKERTAVEV